MCRHEDIRTAIYSFAHTLRDNVDKLERHERRVKQSGDQMQNLLSTIVNKQREQFVEEKELETSIKNLEQSLNLLTNAETEKVITKNHDYLPTLFSSVILCVIVVKFYSKTINI